MNNILNFASELNNTLKLQTERIETLERLTNAHITLISSLKESVYKLEQDNQAISLINQSLSDRMKILIDEDIPKTVSDEVEKEINLVLTNDALDDKIKEQVDDAINSLEFTISTR